MTVYFLERAMSSIFDALVRLLYVYYSNLQRRFGVLERQEEYNNWMDNGGDHKRFILLYCGGIKSAAADEYFQNYLKLCRQIILPGRYRHFKIGADGSRYYTIHGVGQHTERKEVLVSYSPDYGNEKDVLYFRPAYMFLETIDRDDYKGPRFIRVD